MKVSIIIPTYNDVIALKLILNSLEAQTYKNFEVIIAEDSCTKELIEFLNKYNTNLDIKHFSHEDKGNRKAIIINKVLHHVSGEYIIFIDGDVIPFSNFIESHVILAEKKSILCGRRVNLGEKVSNDLRDEKITALKIEKSYFSLYTYLKDDNLRHYEQGFRFKPNSLLFKLINYFNKNIHILGSNFSCFKDDIDKINGFDEDIIGGSKDDVDLEWRFIMSGCTLKSCKYCANLFHLNHDRSSRKEEENIAKKQMEKNKQLKQFICKNGINKF